MWLYIIYIYMFMYLFERTYKYREYDPTKHVRSKYDRARFKIYMNCDDNYLDIFFLFF